MLIATMQGIFCLKGRVVFDVLWIKRAAVFTAAFCFFLFFSLNRHYIVLQLNDYYSFLSSSVLRICSACFSSKSGASVNG